MSGHTPSCLGQPVHQELHVAQQIDGEGAWHNTGLGFTDIFTDAGIPAIFWHLAILLQDRIRVL